MFKKIDKNDDGIIDFNEFLGFADYWMIIRPHFSSGSISFKKN